MSMDSAHADSVGLSSRGSGGAGRGQKEAGMRSRGEADGAQGLGGRSVLPVQGGFLEETTEI